MAGHTPAPGHAVKLPLKLYASAILAAEMHGRTVGQWVEMAVEAQLERDRHRSKVERYEAAKRTAVQTRRTSPMAQDFGLPADYGIPPAFR